MGDAVIVAEPGVPEITCTTGGWTITEESGAVTYHKRVCVDGEGTIEQLAIISLPARTVILVQKNQEGKVVGYVPYVSDSEKGYFFRQKGSYPDGETVVLEEGGQSFRFSEVLTLEVVAEFERSAQEEGDVSFSLFLIPVALEDAAEG